MARTRLRISEARAPARGLAVLLGAVVLLTAGRAAGQGDPSRRPLVLPGAPVRLPAPAESEAAADEINPPPADSAPAAAAAEAAQRHAEGPGKSADGSDAARGPSRPTRIKTDARDWPIKARSPPPPPPPPVPPLPAVAGMGGFPKAPEKSDSPSSLQEFIRDNLSVTLRGGGTLRPYGWFRGDLDFATSRMAIDLQNPFFVLPDDPRFRAGPSAVPIKPDDLNYALYPRLSRFGLEYYGQPIELLCGAVPGGRVEIDFLTPASPVNPESRELLRLRLAYATLHMGEFTLVVGQDWDLIAPLIPTVNDNTYLWNAGNLGDRRPQVKLLWDHDLGDGRVLQVQNGLILADAINSSDLDGNGARDQEDFGVPAYEGRIGLVLPSRVPGEKVLAGIWGMAGYDETDGTLPPPPLPVPGQADPAFSQLAPARFGSGGLGADLRLPLAPGLTFQGEAWAGANLDEYRGGIAQGINVPRRKLIRAAGGWGELVCKPLCWYQLAVGASVDCPNRRDVEGINQVLFPGFPQGVNVNAGRSLNWTWYVSNRLLLGSGLTVGIEYINWNTEYVGFNDGHASLVKFFLQQVF